jgi:hypothetical protein
LLYLHVSLVRLVADRESDWQGVRVVEVGVWGVGSLRDVGGKVEVFSVVVVDEVGVGGDCIVEVGVGCI